MKLAEKLQKIWENRAQIAEGAFNYYLSTSEDVKQEAARRLAICRTNTCGYWDEHGTAENTVVRGKEACGLCGCNLTIKTAAMNVQCALGDHDQTPLWEKVMDEEQDKEYHQKEWEQQFKKNK